MGLFSAVIDRSPIDKFGAGASASAQTGMANAAFNQSQDMWNMNSARNQMQRQQMQESAFDVQAQTDMMQRRQAARTGQSYNQIDTTSAINQQVQGSWMQQMMANQQASQGMMGMASQMQSSAASTRNSLNQMYRQQQQANQQAKQQAKAAAMSAVGGLAAGLGGPLVGQLGSKIATGILGPAK
jgi:predicted phage gp36 major capsid-like protein